jgi:peroxiredoxin Q/BCP
MGLETKTKNIIMLKIGEKLPEFQVENQDGNLVKSSDFKGKKLVIFFYPKANTPGCTAEACNLNENIEYLTKQGFTILGISADSVKNQKKFHTKFDLNMIYWQTKTTKFVKNSGFGNSKNLWEENLWEL